MEERFIVSGFTLGTSPFVICDDGTLWQGIWNGVQMNWIQVPGPPKYRLKGDNQL